MTSNRLRMRHQPAIEIILEYALLNARRTKISSIASKDRIGATIIFVFQRVQPRSCDLKHRYNPDSFTKNMCYRESDYLNYLIYF